MRLKKANNAKSKLKLFCEIQLPDHISLYYIEYFKYFLLKLNF